MQPRSSNHDDTSPNKHYESDIRYAFQFCHWILRPIGVHPFVYSNVSKLERVVSIALLIASCSVLQFIVVPAINYALFHEQDTNAKIKFLGPIMYSIIEMIKCIYVCLKGPAFGRCIKHVERDWRMLQDQDHRDIMISHITMGRNLIKVSALFLYTGGLSYHTIMPLLSKVKTDENATIRQLAYPDHGVLFDVQQSPNYEIVYCMHCLYVLVVGNITLVPYSLASIFTSHACGQMRIQILRLENLMNERKPRMEGEEDPLAVIVRDHAKVLRFTKNIEESFREICLLEVVMSTMLICLLEYYCMVEWSTNDSIAIFTYVALLISFVFNILMFCYLGELLLEQGNNIAFASYGAGWYNLPARKARGIVLLLAVSKYPPKLTAGQIFDLSLNTFGNVLKSSLVYLNLVQTVTEF